MSYAESLSSFSRETVQKDGNAPVAAGSIQVRTVSTEVQTAAKLPEGNRSLSAEETKSSQQQSADSETVRFESEKDMNGPKDDAVTQASALTGVYVNAAKAKFEKGTHSSMVTRIKERCRGRHFKKLKPDVEELLKNGHMATLSTVLGSSKKDREAMPLLAEAFLRQHAPGTSKSYAATWLRFVKWCQKVDKSTPIPAEPATVLRYQAFLIKEAMEKNLSVANAEASMQAIRHFHEIYGFTSPTNSPLVKSALKGMKRMLGNRGVQKKGLTSSNIRQMYKHYIEPDPENIGYVAMLCRVALAQEGLLRFDDMNNLLMSDILITNDCLHIFIWESKTDRMRQGQWAIVHRDDQPWKAYPLFKRLIEGIQKQWEKIAKLPWARRRWEKLILTDDKGESYLGLNDMPFLFSFEAVFKKWRSKGKPAVFLPSSEKRRVTYDAFRNKLKEWVQGIGLDPQEYSTHSLRRGGASTLSLIGLSDAQIMKNGRWKSASVMNQYIDWEVDLALRVRAAQQAQRS